MISSALSRSCRLTSFPRVPGAYDPANELETGSSCAGDVPNFPYVLGATVELPALTSFHPSVTGQGARGGPRPAPVPHWRPSCAADSPRQGPTVVTISGHPSPRRRKGPALEVGPNALPDRAA